jgi:hypothetical protein
MGSPTNAKRTRLPLASPNGCRNAHSFGEALRLGDGHLPLAGDRAGDGIGGVHRNSIPVPGMTW